MQKISKTTQIRLYSEKYEFTKFNNYVIFHVILQNIRTSQKPFDKRFYDAAFKFVSFCFRAS